MDLVLHELLEEFLMGETVGTERVAEIVAAIISIARCLMGA
jgi:hypothetical protein